MNAAQSASSVNSLTLNTRSGGFSKTSSNVDFSSKLKNGMAKGASLTYQSVAPMAPFVPGGAVMSAMLSNAAGSLASDGVAAGGLGGGVAGANMSSGFSGGGLPGLPAGGAAGVSAPGANGNMFDSMEHLQQNMMSMNVYMLGLQQGFNEMNQKYTAVSNILKTKHDTEKNAIQNFR
ncbi:MAG: hypothetical protein V4534_06705 [Myxococcota bacterium]